MVTVLPNSRAIALHNTLSALYYMLKADNFCAQNPSSIGVYGNSRSLSYAPYGNSRLLEEWQPKLSEISEMYGSVYEPINILRNIPRRIGFEVGAAYSGSTEISHARSISIFDLNPTH